MLTALLSSLQSSLNTIFSKPFVIGSLFPLILFVGACTTMAQHVGGKPKAWVALVNPVINGAAPWNVTVLIVIVIGLALLLSGLNTFLLELLEGKHLGWFSSLLYIGQSGQIRQVDFEIHRVKMELVRFDNPLKVGSTTSAYVALQEDLANSAAAGRPAVFVDETLDEAGRRLLRLRAR